MDERGRVFTAIGVHYVFKSAMDQKRPIVYTPVRYYENGTPFLGGGMGLSALLPVSRPRSAAARPATFTLT